MTTPLEPPGLPRPNTAFRALRGELSPAEFAASVRRAAREIGEQVSCDARYVGRVESGAIRCPNYAYERVFRHMFPGLALVDLGFAPRESVRGHRARGGAARRPGAEARAFAHSCPDPGRAPGPRLPGGPESPPGGAGRAPLPPLSTTITAPHRTDIPEEPDVLRRAFMIGGPMAATAATSSPHAALRARGRRRAGATEATAVEDAVRRIRLLDDQYGADTLYVHASQPLRMAYALLDEGGHRGPVATRLHAGTGELAISVGWLAHDSGRHADARSHYAEALATARVTDDAALEAHAFCNTAFLARDTGRPREAVRAAQAAQQAAQRLSSPRLRSLLALREAGGWAGLDDGANCRQALLRAHTYFAEGPSDDDPEWMTFYGEAELEGLEAQCWSALGDWDRAVEHARRAVALQDPHFTRNIALFTAELANDLLGSGTPDTAAVAAGRALELLAQVRSSRIRLMLDATARALRQHARNALVSDFLDRHAASVPAPV